MFKNVCVVVEPASSGSSSELLFVSVCMMQSIMTKYGETTLQSRGCLMGSDQFTCTDDRKRERCKKLSTGHTV